MRKSIVLASPRYFKEKQMFDHECTPIIVSNAPDGNFHSLGFSLCNVKLKNLGFSFSIYL